MTETTTPPKLNGHHKAENLHPHSSGRHFVKGETDMEIWQNMGKATEILACRMVAEPWNMIYIADQLKPEMFHNLHLPAIFACMDLYAQKKTYSAYSVAQWIIGGGEYRVYGKAHQAEGTTNTEAHISAMSQRHADITLPEAFENFRHIYAQYVEFQIGEEVGGLIRKGFTAEEIRIWGDKTRKERGAILSNKTSDGKKEFGAALESALIGEHIDYPAKPSLRDMRKQIEFYEPGEYIIIGGRTGMGKSYYGLKEAYYMALQGTPSAYVNLENTPKSVHARLWQFHTGIKWQTDYKNRPWWSVKSGIWTQHNKLAKEDVAYMKRTWAEVQALPIKVFNTGRHLQTILNTVRQDFYERGTAAFIFDYVQLMKDNEKRGKVEDLAHISAESRGICLDLNTVLFALAQLNRDGEKAKSDHRCKISDLRYCGDLEQDASTIKLLYRPSVYDIRTDPKTKAEYPAEYADVHVGKGRNTGVCLVGCRFNSVEGFYDAPQEVQAAQGYTEAAKIDDTPF